MHSHIKSYERNEQFHSVLILVVMEDALAREHIRMIYIFYVCLNPCCNGRCTRTKLINAQEITSNGLNPCCNGRCTRTLPDLDVPHNMTLS